MRPVAVTGQQVPGAPAGVTYRNFEVPGAARNGQIAFAAALQGTDVTSLNDRAIMSGFWNGPQIVAREGDQAFGMPAGVTYNSVGSFARFIGPDGTISFGASLAGGGITSLNNSAAYVGKLGNLTLVARKGDHAPGTVDGVTFQSVGGSHIGNGHVAFTATLTGTNVTSSNNTAVYAGAPGSLNLVARTNSAAPGVGANVGFSYLGSVNPDGANGVSTFFARLQGQNVTGTNSDTVYAVTASGASLLMREGVQAPSLPAGVTVYSVAEVESGIGENGHMLLDVGLAGSVTAANDGVLYAGPASALSPIVRDGDDAPGAGTGVKLSVRSNTGGGDASGFAAARVNGQGDVAFLAELTGSSVTAANNSAIYAGPYDAYALIAREGDQAPGFPAGVQYGDLFSPSGIFPRLGIADTDDVMFTAALTGTGISNDSALFYYDPDEGASLVARVGQIVDLGNGDLRTVSSLTSTVPQLSRDGRLLFGAAFTDGSSALLTAVPEPSSLTACVAAGLLLLRRRRRGA